MIGMWESAQACERDGKLRLCFDMSVVANQRQIFLRLTAQLQPHWRNDSNLPARLQKLFAAHRNFGSRDRRLYRELVYTTVRYLPWIEPLLASDPEKAAGLVAWFAEETPATHAYRAALTADRPPRPDALADKAALIGLSPSVLLPEWLQTQCPSAFKPEELEALHRRAPLWLRLQTDDVAKVTEEFDHRGWRYRPSPLTSRALEVLTETDITVGDAYLNGRVEIQDLGSQLILESLGLPVGGHWLDACAGAGGKTLQLAQLIGPTGKIDAYDIRSAALEELVKRSTRAGLRNITTLHRPATGIYDGVLVDAPCSGSGTWRRSPHLKWTTTPAMIASYAARQLALLAQHAAKVRPGGWLVYATCSLNRQENGDVAQAFAQAHPAFTAVPPVRDFGYAHDDAGAGLNLLPARHNTDGFYVAAWRRV